MSSFQLCNIESSSVVVESENLSAYYQSKLNDFKNTNLLFRNIESDNQPGFFIYNVNNSVIEYADNIFLNSHQINNRQLNHSPIQKLLQRSLKQDEINRFIQLGNHSKTFCKNGYLSTIVNCIDLNGDRHQYNIQLLKCKDLITNENLRIGIQFNLTVNGSEELIASHFYQDYRQQLLGLSNRELEVVSCIVKGDTDTDISDKLCISIYTAKKHRKNILRKLKLKNTALLAYKVGKANLF
jgi:DNA-binding CsgD family transcriptional regulator